MASTSTVKRLRAVEESPNWLELPHELMANILKRLGDVEILNSAVKVCTTWRRIGRDPAMWKVINMYKPARARNANYDLEALTTQAVHLSSGELIDISLEGFGTDDDFLYHIVSRSSKLNSLCLTNCYNITGSGLTHVLKRALQLEKLYITYTSSIKYNEVVVPNCPHLKSFKLDKACIYEGIVNDDDALAIAKNMPELRQLQLYGNAMSNNGLKAILDGCPHLESLDIRMCYNVDINGNELKPSLERLKSFKGPNDSTENCGFHPRVFENVDSDDSLDYYFDGCGLTDDDDDDDAGFYIDYYSL
ncbi:hypothetical protein LXL04_027567 [Taraxacum kok-saghyz]